MKALFFENNLARALALKAASKFNRYAALGRLSTLRYEEVPEPKLPNPRWLKVRNLACGLCGTDIHFMFMDMDPKVYPAAIPGIPRKYLGHELLGEVVETGAEVDNVKPGDRVAMRIDWPSCYQLEIDPPCPRCAEGSYMLCENVGSADLPLLDVGGGFSPYMVMHKSQPFRVPDALTNDAALLLEPLASALHGVFKAPPEPHEHVLVLGAGAIGLLTVAAARHVQPQATITCVVRHEFQAALAEKLGARVLYDRSADFRRMADVSGARYAKGYLGNEILLGGFDVVYDTVGNDASLNRCLRFARSGGRVVLIGINFTPGHLDYSTIWARELNVTGINCHGLEADGRNSFDHAAEILAAGRIDPSDFITHRFKMSDYKNAVKAFTNKSSERAIKIILDHA